MVKETKVVYEKGSQSKMQKHEGTTTSTHIKDVKVDNCESSNSSAEFSAEEIVVKVKNEESICYLKGSITENVNEIYNLNDEKCTKDKDDTEKDFADIDASQESQFKLNFELPQSCAEIVSCNLEDMDTNSDFVSSDDECYGYEGEQVGKLGRPVVATSSEGSGSPRSPVYDENNLLKPLNSKVSPEVCANMSDVHSYSPMSVYDYTSLSSDDDDDCASNGTQNSAIKDQPIVASSSSEDTDPTKTDYDSNDEDLLKSIEESKSYFKNISNVLNLEITTETEKTENSSIDQRFTSPTTNLQYSPKAISLKSGSDDSFSTVHAWKRKKPNFLEDTDSEHEFELKSEPDQDFDRKFLQHQIHQRKSRMLEIPAPSVSVTTHPNENRAKPFISDFDQMLQKKRDERSKAHSSRNLDFITKNDDLIDQLIDRMEEAAYEDRYLNEQGLPATKKVSMLKYVTSQLIKKDLQQLFLEHNILSTLTEWLSPLPSKCLPCIQIRESILRILADFPTINSVLLKESGIGKALMYLRKHPEETKANRERCNRLIAQWARPIHNLTCDYRAMSKKERQERDVELSMRFKKQISKQPTSSNGTQQTAILDKAFEVQAHNKHAPRPGERGWVPRARVPQPSTKDYVRRPQSQLMCEISTKLKPNRYEVLAKKYQTAKRTKVHQNNIVGLSVFGSKT